MFSGISSSTFFAAKLENVKTWNAKEGSVVLSLEGRKPIVNVSVGKENHNIDAHDIVGIPMTLYFDKNKLEQYLKDSHIKLKKLDNGDCRIYIISPKEGLKGGGNTIDPNTHPELLWPNGEVPYYINTTDFPANAHEYKEIVAGIKMWNDRSAETGIKFVPRNSLTTQPDYIAFETGAEYCQSPVGRQGGKQHISCDLYNGFDGGSIAHELGHAIGLYHEQSRTDRASYIDIKEADHNYAAKGKRHGKYDLDSIMHYGEGTNIRVKQSAYSSASVRHPTSKVGQRDHLSQGDIAAVAYLYNQPHGTTYTRAYTSGGYTQADSSTSSPCCS